MSGMKRLELTDALELCRRLPVKYAAIAAIGVPTGCRISEITALRRRDLIDSATGELRETVAFLKLKARKGPKSRKMTIPATWRKFIVRHLNAEAERGHTGPEEFVFRGQNGKALSRLAVYRFFRETLGPEHGTHWMRKTFAYEMFRHFQRRTPGDPLRALELTRRALGHERIETTVRYLGIDESAITDAQNEVFNTGREEDVR